MAKREKKPPTFIPKNHVTKIFEELRKGVYYPLTRSTLRDAYRWDVMYRLIYIFALRRGEVPLLRVEEINLTERLIYIRRLKNGISKYMPFEGDVEQLLRSWVAYRADKYNVEKDEGVLFPRKDGTAIGVLMISKEFKSICMNIGFARGYAKKRKSIYTVHHLRHACALHMRNEHFPMADITDRLGHRNINSTAQYARVSDPLRAEISKSIYNSDKFAKV